MQSVGNKSSITAGIFVSMSTAMRSFSQLFCGSLGGVEGKDDESEGMPPQGCKIDPFEGILIIFYRTYIEKSKNMTL